MRSPTSTLICQLVFSLRRLCLFNHVVESSCEPLPCPIQKIHHRRCPGSLVPTIFSTPLLRCSLSLRCEDCAADVLLGVELTMVGCSLKFDQFCLTVMISFYSKKKLLWCEAKTSVFCGYENMYLECNFEL